MATISERLRFRAKVKGDADLSAGRKSPEYGPESELDWQAADTIDALVAVLENLLVWAGPIAGDNIDKTAAEAEESSVEAARAALARAKG